ncbi:MAG TPA: hypothetical protein ENN55_04735 [Firmicutes bacterium]|nr:hypothetical protein [Bacillota bacterium]
MEGYKKQEKSIGEMLVDAGKITRNDLEQTLREQQNLKEPIGKILVKKGMVSETDILQLLKGLQAVVFEINDELFALEVIAVKEILKCKRITPIPAMPDFILGMMSVRNEVIPVVSINKKIFKVAEDVTDETRIIILEMKDSRTGIMTDRVHAVKNFESSSLERSGKYSVKMEAKYVGGIIKDGEKLITLLNPEAIMEGN